MDEKKLKHLEELIKLASNSLTKEDFVEAFQVVADTIEALKKDNEKEFSLMQKALDALTKKVKEDAQFDVGELRQEVERVVGMQLTSIQSALAKVKDGKTPKKGVDYFDGEDGADALPPTKQELIALIKPLIPEPKEGPPGPPGDAGTTVRVGWGAHPLQIQGLGVVIDKNTRVINFKGTGLSSVTRLPNGVVEVTLQAGGAGSTFYTETPSGLINSSNTSYTVLHSITTVFNICVNGQFLHPTVDYTFSGTTITLVTALDASLSGSPFTITYA